MIRFILPDKYKENLIQADKSFCFCLFSSVKKQTIILQNSFNAWNWTVRIIRTPRTRFSGDC